MKILVVSQYFWPEEFRINDLVLRMQANGHNVEVLTGVPNYPGGKLFGDYEVDPSKFSSYNAVKIHRVGHIARGKSKASLVLNYLSFALLATFYVIFKLRKENYDVVLAVQLSPITSVLPAIVACKVKKIKLVTWVLDLWPDIILALNKLENKFALVIITGLSRWIYRKSDILLITSHGFRKRLLKFGIEDDKIIYFPQWIEQSILVQEQLDRPLVEKIDSVFNKLRYQTKIVFTGNIGESQNFEAVVEAMALLRSSDKITLVVVGDGRKITAIKNLANDLNVSNKIIFMGRFELKYMNLVMSHADALLLPLGSDRLFELTLPGKTQTYLYSGKPIIGILNGEGANVIKQADAGYVVPANDSQKLAETMKLFAAQNASERQRLGANGRKYAEKYFLPENVMEILEKCLD